MPLRDLPNRALAALLLAAASAVPASATFVWVEMSTQNTGGGFPNNGGPEWTGVVDTDADTLTIHTWVELDGTPDAWTPLNLTLTWPAVDASGNRFNVTDDYFDAATGTFHVTQDFAFISPLSVRQMSWQEGVWGELPNDVVDPVGIDFFPGWGGYAVRNSALELVYDVDGRLIDGVFATYDETWMPKLPSDITQHDGQGNQTFRASTIIEVRNGAVTAQIVANSDGPTAVPEASAVWFVLVATLVAGSLAAWQRRRRTPQCAAALAARPARHG